MQTEILRTKPASARTQRCRGLVLIVDDEAQNRELLKDPLEAHGYEIVEAANGEEALQKVLARPPDVIAS